MPRFNRMVVNGAISDRNIFRHSVFVQVKCLQATNTKKYLLLKPHRLPWRGITSNLARCRYGEIRLRDGKQYKRATFDEPVVAVVPGRLGLGRYDDGKLFCSTAYTMVTEDFMGIQFHYPKKVQYEKNGVCGPWFSTKDLNSYQDFENLKTTIRGMTRPLTLKSGDEQRRLDIRITDEAREQIRGCYLFREYGVTVK